LDFPKLKKRVMKCTGLITLLKLTLK
jgi:hypothetical protein